MNGNLFLFLLLPFYTQKVACEKNDKGTKNKKLSTPATTTKHAEHSSSGSGSNSGVSALYAYDLDALEDLVYRDLLITEILLFKQKLVPSKGALQKVHKVINNYVEDVFEGLSLRERLRLKQGPPWDTESDRDSESDLWSDKWLSQRALEVTHNPLSAFRLIYRLYYKLPKLEDRLKRIKKETKAKYNFDFDDLWQLLPGKSKLPNEDDLFSMLSGISRFVFHGHLPPKGLADGHLFGVNLTMEQCYDIGVTMGADIGGTWGRLYAILWFSLALIKRRKSKGDRKFSWDDNDPEEIQEELANAINDLIIMSTDFPPRYLHKLPVANQKHGPQIHVLKPADFESDTGFKFSLDYLEKMVDATWEILTDEKTLKRNKLSSILLSQGNIKDNYVNSQDMEAIYYELCSGHDLQPQDFRQNLFCWYEHHADLYYKIGPMKLEFLSRDPDIVHIYQVIGPNTIKKFDFSSNKPLKPREKFKNKTQANSARSSNSEDKDFKDDKVYIDEKAQVQALLSALKHSKLLFGFGFGEVKLESSSFVDEDSPLYDQEENENRMAAFQVNLYEDPVGGETSFPLALVKAPNFKGSAVMWLTRSMNGNSDEILTSAECQVVRGRKFTMTVFPWTAFVNLKHFSCPSKHTSRFQVQVNGQIPYRNHGN